MAGATIALGLAEGDGAAGAVPAPATPIVVPTTTATANVLLLPRRIASSLNGIRDLNHEYPICPKWNTQVCGDLRRHSYE